MNCPYIHTGLVPCRIIISYASSTSSFIFVKFSHLNFTLLGRFQRLPDLLIHIPNPILPPASRPKQLPHPWAGHLADGSRLDMMRLAVEISGDRIHPVLTASGGPSRHVCHQLWVDYVEEALLAHRHLGYVGHGVPVLLPKRLFPGAFFHVGPEVDIVGEALAVRRRPLLHRPVVAFLEHVEVCQEALSAGREVQAALARFRFCWSVERYEDSHQARKEHLNCLGAGAAHLKVGNATPGIWVGD